MRCRACDCELTDFEATVKYLGTDDFLDLCARCRAPIAHMLDTSERFDLYDPDMDVIDFPTDDEDESRPTVSTPDGDGESG